jgi:hypothetical protein
VSSDSSSDVPSKDEEVEKINPRSAVWTYTSIKKLLFSEE